MTNPRRTLAKIGAVVGISVAALGVAAPASASIAPNRFVNVYSCTYWGTGCRYWYTYQENGSYNPAVSQYDQYRRVNVYNRAW